MTKFPGFPKEPATNYWPYPKALNGWWHILSGAEQKILDYILRHTWGFKKNADFISYSQFKDGVRGCDKGCGLKSDTTIAKALVGLESKGFINRSGGEPQSGKTRRYTLTFLGTPENEELFDSSSKNGERSPENEEGSSENGDTIKDLSTKDIINNNNIYKKNSPQQNIWLHYCNKFQRDPRRYKLSVKRVKKINNRLKEFSEAAILKAITNASEDYFYAGNNNRGWTADLDYITRSYEIMERLYNLKPRKTNTDYQSPKNVTVAKKKGKYANF